MKLSVLVKPHHTVHILLHLTTVTQHCALYHILLFKQVSHIIELLLHKIPKYHFNISKKGVDSREFLRGMKGFVPVLYALYENRLSNRFCRARNWNHYFSNIDKYSAFYLKTSNIVEIRLFSRITNYKVMMWRIKLMQTLMQDYGRNLNQFVLKMSATENSLYQLLREQYTHQRIADKIQLVDKYSEMYNCGTISNSVRTKVNERFGWVVLPLK